jgi:thiol-disulfide isomerase/thioredoxin
VGADDDRAATFVDHRNRNRPMPKPPARPAPLLSALGLALAIAALPAAAGSPAPAAGAAAWHTRLEPALAEARETGHPILVDLYAEWCGWCKRLDREVFSSTRFAEYTEEDFVLLRVDVEDEGEGTWLQERLGAVSLPTLAILDADLVRLGTVRGYHTLQLFLLRIDRALLTYREALAADEKRMASDDPAVLFQTGRDLLARQDGKRAATVYQRLLAREGEGTAQRVVLLVHLAEAQRLARRFDDAGTTLATARRALAALEAPDGELVDSVDVATLRLADDRDDCGAVVALEDFLRERGKSRWAERARSELAERKAGPAEGCS